MSIQAALIRTWIRWWTRPVERSEETIVWLRAQTDRFTRMSPRPPGNTRTENVLLGGVPTARVSRPASRVDRQVLYLHGGAYCTGSPPLYRHISWRFADVMRATINMLDYRLAPEFPFPAAIEDAAAAWDALLAQGADPRRCIVMGDSAGGGLSLALALWLRDQGRPLPGAIVSISPWTDLALTGETLRQHRLAMPLHQLSEVMDLAAAYLGGADPRHPYASPLFGDPAGLPPTLIQVGGDESLLDDSVRMAARMRDAGCTVELEVWPRMPHVWHAFATVMPEARRAIARIGEFARSVIEID
ncbi:MAG: alpha/beta hydrolase [Alphaproteobacteria bacterium]|nr:alpha/beta hydrolase [Alphaproteobacteria bacterium]